MCWTYETSLMAGVELSHTLPYSEYLIGPDFFISLFLHPEVQPRHENANFPSYLLNRAGGANALPVEDGGPCSICADE